MNRPRSTVLLLAALALTATMASRAEAANIVYVHGRSMDTWPAAGRLVAAPGWTHVTMWFNGSARLGDGSVRSAVREQLRTSCTTTDCVVVCYSAGCARTLIAYSDLAAQGVTPRVLWTEALASAAGGTELAEYSTNNGLRLLAKIFLTNPGPPAESVDHDLPPDNMRYSTWSFIQGAARAPVYHLAGNRDICIKTKIRGLSMIVSSVARWSGLLPAGPVGWVIGGVLGALFGSAKVKLCGNKVMPGRLGDGAVPVHSAAGYADRGAHGSHHDGSAKYPYRAYEQVPLFDRDHTGIFGPGVQFGSLRLAVSTSGSQCANAVNAADNGESEASIVYEDADGPNANTTTEVAPIAILQICGNDMFASSTDRPLWATCYGQGGCCDSFSTGTTSGCTCGETLCTQSNREAISYFTGSACDGHEYSVGGSTWDGQGMVGATPTTVTVRSVRRADGRCEATTRRVTYRGSCADYWPASKTMSANRVYRPHIDQYAADPNGAADWPGYVVASQNYNTYCP